MSNQDKSTSTANLNQHVAVWRETWLRRYLPPEVAASCRVFGEYLYSVSLEAAGYIPEPRESEERADLRAAAVDLRLVQFYLEHIASGREHFYLDAEDEALAQLADSFALELRRLVFRMERVVGTEPVSEGAPAGPVGRSNTAGQDGRCRGCTL